MNVKIELAGSVARVTVGNEEHTITASVADGCTHAPGPHVDIHTPAEDRVRMLVAQIDRAEREANERGRKIEALERQLDDERAARVTHHEALEGLAEQLHTADADRVPLRMDLDKARKTIARMQPLCDVAQRAANAWRHHVGDVYTPLTSPEIAVMCDLDVAERAYETACTDAANAVDLPF